MGKSQLQKRLFIIIFGTDTLAGKRYDLILLGVIFASVLVVMLDSIKSINYQYGDWFYLLEWMFTIIFSVEYLFRLWIAPSPVRYATSIFGIIDLISILPTYISLFVPGAQYFLSMRALRMLRVFRIIKAMQYISEGNMLIAALEASRRKILIFMFFLSILVTIVGSVMYMVESEHNQNFANIPISIYWCVVTITTVGYGDISPITSMGRALSALLMLVGYAMIAVPTGIVSAEVIKQKKMATAESGLDFRCCVCNKNGHDTDADFCKYCGAPLNEDSFIDG